MGDKPKDGGWVFAWGKGSLIMTTAFYGPCIQQWIWRARSQQEERKLSDVFWGAGVSLPVRITRRGFLVEETRNRSHMGQNGLAGRAEDTSEQKHRLEVALSVGRKKRTSRSCSAAVTGWSARPGLVTWHGRWERLDWKGLNGPIRERGAGAKPRHCFKRPLDWRRRCRN